MIAELPGRSMKGAERGRRRRGGQECSCTAGQCSGKRRRVHDQGTEQWTDQWNVGQRRERSGEFVEASNGYPQHGPHDHWIELRTGSFGEFTAGYFNRIRLLVGPGHGHHGEGVSDRHDAARQRDFLASETAWIPASVPPFVVLISGMHGISEPRRQWGKDPTTFGRVIAKHRPLRLARPTGTVENRGRHGELAHVMEDRPPPQALSLFGIQSQFLAQLLAIGPNAFGVPARTFFVYVKCTY